VPTLSSLHFGIHRGCTATALERRRCDDIDDASTEHFGIHRRCSATASARRRCNRISPMLCCLLTQPVRMASKSTSDAENVYASLVMGSIGAQ